MADDEPHPAPPITAAAIYTRIDEGQAEGRVTAEDVKVAAGDLATALAERNAGLDRDLVERHAALAVKLQETASSLAEGLAARNVALDAALLERQHALDASLQSVADDVRKLRVYVIDGNGQPGLVTRVATIEANHKYDRAAIEALARGHDTIIAKLDKIDDSAASAAEAAIAREIADSKDRKGWLVAILVGVLGFLGALVPFTEALFRRLLGP